MPLIRWRIIVCVGGSLLISVGTCALVGSSVVPDALEKTLKLRSAEEQSSKRESAQKPNSSFS